MIVFEFSRGTRTIIHSRHRDQLGFLRDDFVFEVNYPGGGTVKRPFFPPGKVKNDDDKTDAKDLTSNYTREEYEKMMDDEMEKPVQRTYG